MFGTRVQSGRVRQDPYPKIRPAGWVPQIAEFKAISGYRRVPLGIDDNSDHCIRQDVH